MPLEPRGLKLLVSSCILNSPSGFCLGSLEIGRFLVEPESAIASFLEGLVTVSFLFDRFEVSSADLSLPKRLVLGFPRGGWPFWFFRKSGSFEFLVVLACYTGATGVVSTSLNWIL